MQKNPSIYDLMQESTQSLSSGKWPDFLRSASWNFRFKFPAQCLIFAQRPDATACYTFEDWHRRFDRRIKHGAKGIALIDDRTDQLSLNYVFDYKDTYSPEGSQLSSWSMTPEKEPAVRNVLARELMPDDFVINLSADPVSFYGSLVSELLNDRISDTLPDLLSVRTASRLSELSESRVEELYRSILHDSITALVMHRLGLDPNISDERFSGISYFNTDETMSILGNSVQSISIQILREAARTVAAWDKAHKQEEIKNEQQHNIPASRGVSGPEPDHPQLSQTEQIRTTSQEIPAGASGESLHLTSDERPAAESLAPGGSDNREAGERDDHAPHDNEPAAHEREGEPGVDTAHGNAETPGRRTDPAGDDLHLNFFTNQQMTAALLAGPDIEGGKYRIHRAFEEKQPGLAKVLSKEYGQGGRSFLFQDGTEGQLSWDASGISFHAPGFQPATLSWHTVSNRIRDLVDAGRYLDEQEKLQSQRYFADQTALRQRQEHEVILRSFFSIYGPRDHDSILLNDEALRAFTYENSKTARSHLIATFDALSETSAVQQDAIALKTVSDLLEVLRDDTRPEFSSHILSAADLGFSNPFPSDSELTSRTAVTQQPLNRDPLSSLPTPTPEHSLPTGSNSSIPDEELPEEGAVVTLAGLRYVVVQTSQDSITLQDTEHPLFTQELPLSLYRTLRSNTEPPSVRAHPNRSQSVVPPVADNSPDTEKFTDNSSSVNQFSITAKSANLSDSEPSVLPVLTLRTRIADTLRSGYASYLTTLQDPDLPDTDELAILLDDFLAFGNQYAGKPLTAQQEQDLRIADDTLKAFAATAFRMYNSEHEHVRQAGDDVISACCALCRIERTALYELARTSDWISVYSAEPAGNSKEEAPPEPKLPGLQRRGENAARKSYQLLASYAAFLPLVLDRTLKDQAFYNALQYADPENLRVECAAATDRAVLSLNDMVLLKSYYDSESFRSRLQRDILDLAPLRVPQHNPEPELDHPELRTSRHFPAVREDKEMLADLLMFVTDYRSTFARQRPELSASDRTAYDEATEFLDTRVVTESIYENLDNIRNAVHYINAWYLPFSEGLNPEFLESTQQMLERAMILNAEDILRRESERGGDSISESPEDSEPTFEPSVTPESVIAQYDETSFHVGDYYEDSNGRGIITDIYIPAEGVPHEPSFSLIDPDAPEDSRDAKGYVISIPVAISRLLRGEASLSQTLSQDQSSFRSADREEGELSLFDFQFDTPSDASLPPNPEPPREVSVQAAQGIVSQDDRINFRLPSESVPLGGPKARFQNNLSAIRLLKDLEQEGRLANLQEQEILSKYVGWGGLSDAFDPSKSNWSQEYKELKDLLTEDEYEAARESTLTAFYTPPEVIDSIYEVLGNLGFRHGNILDPGCGTGSFSGRLPDQMQESKIYGIEKDSISGRIARQLYQKNNITIEGYEDTKLPDNFFDVAIGNVPFGAFKVSDRRYDKLNLQIHDYFFAKTLDKVRPGGIVAFVTSMGTMDKQNSDFRRYLSQRADLLGAIRLPNNTFKTNAGTDVTSDIIFLQKREIPRVEEADWVDLDRSYDYETGVVGEEVNAYFAANNEMILGQMQEISGPHGPELACIALPGQDLKTALSRAVAQIQGSISEPAQGLYDQEYEERTSIPADPSVRNFSYTLVDDTVYFREDSEMFKVEQGRRGEERIRGLIDLRDTVYALIDAQVEGYSDEKIRNLQRQLNDKYDTFTAKNGLINSRGNSLAFSDDSSYYLLCSLEHVNEKGEFLGKADMFYKRTIHAHEKVDHVDTAQEALAVSLGERGCIDFAFMSQLSGLSRDQLIQQLDGHIFRDPTQPDHYEISALYLSGNVREKLAQAKAAEGEDPGHWQTNIRALERVQPKDLEPADITARLGSTWIPAEDYTQFMYELFHSPSWVQQNGSIQVTYSPYTNTFHIKNGNWDDYNATANSTYGSHRMSGYKILEHTLNLKDVKVFDTVTDRDGTERRVLNEAETMVLQEKQQLIKDAFKDWLWRDSERTERLCKAYNERFNSYVPPKFDGQLVRFHNMNPQVTMRPWQRDAVARILYSGNTLLAHAVGAGKTWTMSAAAKEMKYLGLCNKSMIVVPNHLVGQWASAIYEQYPDAKILASTKKDFETKNRKKFCSRIATGDYDIVIIGHSQFERIPLSQERQEAGIRSEIQKVMDGIAELKAERAEHFTIKQMERMKKSLELRLEKLHNSKKRDDVITFEQLGIDRLFVDESHNYKNLFLYTKMQNVAGISQSDSQRASDMYLKCRYMDELTGNKGNIHATGTPLSNTMAELYATQRYLQHDLLEDMGLETFDQWASTFGETVTSVELAPEGTGYRARTRFANFFNIPELMSLYCQVADIQTADMLDLPLPTPHYENIVVPATEQQKAYVQQLGERAQKIRRGGVRPDEDNMLLITNDGRKLALDQRLINPDWPDDPNSKVNACADNIYRVWTDSAATRGTQLVFCDLSTPTGKGFNVYDDLKQKLVSRGIPAEEIRFVHEANTDAQKEALFQKVRDGQVRVLMGSTGKMGTGTNVQDRLVAGHDLDCPWRPSDLEQRAGRVVRQGNSNKDVYMYRYVTEGTFDAYLYQLVENKQRFISQIYTSKPAARSACDVDEIVLSFAEIKALASGNPLIKERVELEGDIQRLQLLKSRHENAQFRLKHKATQELPDQIASVKKQVATMEKDVAFIAGHPGRTADNRMLPVIVKGKVYEQSKEAGIAILNAVKRAPKDSVTPIGKLRDFTLSVDNTPNSWGKYSPTLSLTGPGTTYSVTPSDSPVGTISRLNNMLDSGIQDKLKYKREYLSGIEHELQTVKSELGKPFTRAAELSVKQQRLTELTHLLDLDAHQDEPICSTDTPPEQSQSRGEERSSLSDLLHSAQIRQTAQIHAQNERPALEHERA